MMRRFLFTIWLTLLPAACATPPVEPFDDTDTLVYIAIRADDLDAYWSWLSDQPGAPVQYEAIRFQFQSACGPRGFSRPRIGAGADLNRSPYAAPIAGWSIAVDRVFPSAQTAPRALTFMGVSFAGYERIALTSADRVEHRYSATGPAMGLARIEAGSSTYLGGYRLLFDRQTGEVELHFDPGGPVLTGLEIQPLEPLESVCERDPLAQ